MKIWSLPRSLPAIFLASLAMLVIFTSGQSRCGQQAQSREEEIRKLLEVARDANLRETNPEQVAGAIKRLGEMKAVETIDDLIGLLTFRIYQPWEKDPHQPRIETHPITSSSRYPAVGALMEIGKPSLAAVVRAIADHGVDTLQGANALEVVRFLFRDRPSAGVDHLNEAAAEASAPEVAQRLLKAAEVLKESKR